MTRVCKVSRFYQLPTLPTDKSMLPRLDLPEKWLPVIGCPMGPMMMMLNASLSACVPSSIDLVASLHAANDQDIDVGDDAASVASRMSSVIGSKVEQWMIVIRAPSTASSVAPNATSARARLAPTLSGCKQK